VTRIRKNALVVGTKNIPAPRPLDQRPEQRHICFSFKYLDVAINEKFRLCHCTYESYEKLFNRLKAISMMTLREFRTCDKDDGYRIHRISWDRTSEMNGFTCLNEQIRENEAWQFQLGRRKGRVHGLLIEEMFFIVWLDPRHQLYPMDQ